MNNIYIKSIIVAAILFAVSGAWAQVSNEGQGQQQPPGTIIIRKHKVAEVETIDVPDERAGSDRWDTPANYGYQSIMPQYPGGDDVLHAYISSQLIYTDADLGDLAKATVYVKYIVGKDGTTQKAEVYSGVNSVLDAEALRVISSLRGFTPGRVQGRPVGVKKVTPVLFVKRG